MLHARRQADVRRYVGGCSIGGGFGSGRSGLTYTFTDAPAVVGGRSVPARLLPPYPFADADIAIERREEGRETAHISPLSGG